MLTESIAILPTLSPLSHSIPHKFSVKTSRTRDLPSRLQLRVLVTFEPPCLSGLRPDICHPSQWKREKSGREESVDDRENEKERKTEERKRKGERASSNRMRRTSMCTDTHGPKTK